MMEWMIQSEKGGMKIVRMSWNSLVGSVILILAISIVLKIVGLGVLLISPFILFSIGFLFRRNNYRRLGFFFFVLALFDLVSSLLDLHFINLLFILFICYFIYRYLQKRGKWSKIFSKSRESFMGKAVHITAPPFRNFLIGDLHLINQQFELTDLNLSFGIGDIKIDLTKAIIPEGETTLVVSGLLGDVDLYIPYDLDISVSTTIITGNIEVLGQKKAGVNCQIALETAGYKEATRKVKISVSLLAGDLDVRHL